MIFDVVYNHASGDIREPAGVDLLFDRAAGADPNQSLYFTDRDHTGRCSLLEAGGPQFLIDNAKFFVEEYHVDCFRSTR